MVSGENLLFISGTSASAATIRGLLISLDRLLRSWLPQYRTSSCSKESRNTVAEYGADLQISLTISASNVPWKPTESYKSSNLSSSG
ncbi:hypothetical protein RRG08_034106 [Elysia crispata]|uniref:Uncharacterized protein n=1 Tax=Elysia crispata TaxID=231223 RepID=A0AAE0Z0R7_9GAST|nr:hypothetical protein RRG08_034106 [Elysia crispata]